LRGVVAAGSDDEAKDILVVGASGSDSSVNTYFQLEMALLLQQRFLKKQNLRVELIVCIGLFAEAVAFIFG
jgi:hypothetical protein